FIAIVLASCAPAQKIPPNTLVMGIETGPRILDPRYATDAISAKVTGLIYAGLMRRDVNMELTPHLAQTITRPHPATYVITLKENLRFHDGRPLTSEDVRFTFESILDEKTASPKKGSFREIELIETPDPLTVVIKLKKPFAPFIGNLTTGIVPASASDAASDLTKNPVGAGPFKFSKYLRGERLELVRNAGYFMGAPKLDGVIFRIVPDETVRLLELKKGNIHLVGNPITPHVLPWLKEQGNIEIITAEGTNVSYIGFNMKDPILKNRNVRRAIAHAIDRDSIIKYMLKDLGIKTETLLAKANRFHAPLEPLEYDIGKSKKLLNEAGYPLKDGKRFSLTYKTSKNPTRKKIAEVFAQQLAEVGIDVSIKSFEWGTFFSDIKKGNFQIYSLTWVGIADPDIYRYIFHSQSLPPDGANRGRYENPELDKLLDAGRVETDFGKRWEIYRRVQEIIAEEMPYIHLWTSVNVFAMNRKVKGFEIYPDESLDSFAEVTLGEEALDEVTVEGK
ncbi:MAG: ABC transporter substrate-binding protein, partial [Nitrospinota bacterium]